MQKILACCFALGIIFHYSFVVCQEEDVSTDTRDYEISSQPEEDVSVVDLVNSGSSLAFGQEYILSPDNSVEITVYGEPDLTTVTKILSDGTISFPLIGTVEAAGLTVKELTQQITQLLSEDYLVNPQVNVIVREFNSFSIFGEIKNPGNYPMKERIALTKAITMAGGFLDSADVRALTIARQTKRGQQTFEVNVEGILAGTDQDVEVQNRDVITVKPYGRFSIMGQVGRPGVYTLKKDLSVLEAISLAGGFSAIAAQNGTKVIRIVDGQKVIIPIPVSKIIKEGDTTNDILLEPGDTIVVPESFF